MLSASAAYWLPWREASQLHSLTHGLGTLDGLEVQDHCDGAGIEAVVETARQKGAPAGEPADHALGRFRGGLTTKIHLAADSRCRPLAFVLTPGQEGDALAFTQVMAQLRVPGASASADPAPRRT